MNAFELAHHYGRIPRLVDLDDGGDVEANFLPTPLCGGWIHPCIERVIGMHDGDDSARMHTIVGTGVICRPCY